MASTDTGFGMVRFFDDFLDDTLNTFWTTVNQDSGTAVLINEQHGGTARCVGTTDGHIQNCFGPEMYRADQGGPLIFECRVKMSSISTGFAVGFTDDNDADEIPADLDDGTLTTTADDVVAIVYDSGKGANWYGVASKAGTDHSSAPLNLGVGPTASTFQTLRVVVDAAGNNAEFFVDGKYRGKLSGACITATTLMAPFFAQKANGTLSNIDVDYVYVQAGRAA